MENLEMEIIAATKVADEDRLNFWLRHVGMAKMLAFERHVFAGCGDFVRIMTEDTGSFMI
jgi:hypothetical protein